MTCEEMIDILDFMKNLLFKVPQGNKLKARREGDVCRSYPAKGLIPKINKEL